MTEAALRGLFDHAGMFPPAEKPFPEALRDAARFADALARPGLVGADLVLPAAQWARLDAKALADAGFPPGRRCRVALVGVPLEEAQPAARLVGEHNASRRGARTPVVGLELHFLDEPGRIHLGAARRAAPGVALFVEPRWGAAAWKAGLAGLVAMLAGQQAGLKFRCAGPTATDRATLAAIVKAVADARIPAKATQGLHHPVPTAAHPHGFLGLLAALRLRQAHGAAFGNIEACLAEGDARAFRLDAGIAWREWSVDEPALPGLPAFAIGSCSLDEPDADLVAAFGPPRL